MQSVIGYPISSQGLIDGLRHLHGRDYAPWFKVREETESITKDQKVKSSLFKPAHWTSVMAVLTAIDNYATLFAKLEEKNTAIKLYLRGINLVFTEYTKKGVNVPVDVQSVVSVMCSKIGANFVELVRMKEAHYWSNEALEHAKMINDQFLICHYSINLGKVMEMEGLVKEAAHHVRIGKQMSNQLGYLDYEQECDSILRRIDALSLSSE